MNKPITFQNSISNEEAALLPAIEFRGPIVVVASEPRLREACRYLAAQPVIGFDTETRPSFRAGVVNRVALLQLSSPEQSFLFRLCKIPLDKAIVKILENKEILKIGADVKGDLRCTSDLESAMRERFGASPIFVPEGKEHFHFDIPVCVSDQFYGWVCGFGGKIEVVSPAEVRDGLRALNERLVKMHQ